MANYLKFDKPPVYRAKSIPWDVYTIEHNHDGEIFISGVYIVHQKTGFTSCIPDRVGKLVLELIGNEQESLT